MEFFPPRNAGHADNLYVFLRGIFIVTIIDLVLDSIRKLDMISTFTGLWQIRSICKTKAPLDSSSQTDQMPPTSSAIILIIGTVEHLFPLP
ncbi:uncharacterized protein LAJ45_00745 [Morchella importuna]|uniref:uncharacterized protein n=1 Tax=Morchella importuna TaxID=1174673 RepID=UPI001E8CF5CC|nr:uncharacterized protein LAJ45_00745 [Morchella importuna]KAH8155735.1 hypothetical protein LAJ45_00745 [Morchella importuna]